MNLILLILSIIEFIVIIILFIMLTKNMKNKFNIEDYEYIILSICRSLARKVNLSNISIDEFAEEVRVEFYHELDKEYIKIKKDVDRLVILDYIKNVIYMNESSFWTEEENTDSESPLNVDEVIKNNNESMHRSTVSIIDNINNFYE